MACECRLHMILLSSTDKVYWLRWPMFCPMRCIRGLRARHCLLFGGINNLAAVAGFIGAVEARAIGWRNFPGWRHYQTGTG